MLKGSKFDVGKFFFHTSRKNDRVKRGLVIVREWQHFANKTFCIDVLVIESADRFHL